jgi:signal transduction histidine kinase
VPAHVDQEHFQRILTNLLSNAFKFTPAGGWIRVGLGAADGQALISVADSGPGVPPAQRELIFERFRQGDSGMARRHSGTGLGLFIVKELVGLHGGTVGVREAVGGGALFEVRLPLSAPPGRPVEPAEEALVLPALDVQIPPAQTDEPPPGPTGPDDPRALVLVIEDHKDMRDYIRTTLDSDYRVALAHDGQSGLERARSLRPDLIISDIMMPSVSGEQVLAALQADPELRDTPVILLTARADPALRVQMLQAGARDYLVKPFSTAELTARAAHLLDTHRARRLLQRQLASQSADLTELAERLAQHTRDLEQAVQARDVFLSIASHELKTPLTALLGFAELLERRAAKAAQLTERDQHTIRIIREQTLRLNRLIAGMLDLSRIDSGQLALDCEWLELGTLVRQVVTEVQNGPQKHTLSLDLPDRPLHLNGDVLRLEQVIYNLLQNAIKYSPRGEPIEVRLSAQAGQAVLAITDRGIGIPEEDLPKLFRRFYRASNVNPQQISGTGIGLYVIREIVTRHGGSVGVTSSVGQGSTFTVSLPLSD